MALIKNVTFANRDGNQLAGRLNYPVGQLRGCVVFAHCFTCSKDTLAAVRIAERLAERGISVLRFDFTGLGQSDGDFGTSGFAGNLHDLADACAWLTETYHAPDIVIGHSLGGAAVLALAEEMPDIVGVATIGAPAVAAHVLHLFDGAEDEITKKGRAEVTIGGRPFAVDARFITDLQSRDNLAHISRLKSDLLILHAPQDQIVGIENAAEIFAAAKHPKSFVSLDKADHLLTKRCDAYFAAEMIAAWASRLLDETQGVRAQEGEVVVTSSPDGPFAHNIAAGPHQMRADEPADIKGGLDSGPAPYDFLLAGLGACTAMTLRMYASHKGWPLQDVTVHLRHEKRHNQDGGNSDNPAAKLDRMIREISVFGPLDDEQITRLLEIADKCPVHKSLEAGIAIETNYLPN